MPFEALPYRARLSGPRTKWAMSCGKYGINLYPPAGHRFLTAAGIHTDVGTKEDDGWIRLTVNPNGRKLNQMGKKGGNGVKFIRYSTLPKAPGTLPITDLETKEQGDAVLIKVPWAPKPFSMLDSNGRGIR